MSKLHKNMNTFLKLFSTTENMRPSGFFLLFFIFFLMHVCHLDSICSHLELHSVLALSLNWERTKDTKTGNSKHQKHQMSREQLNRMGILSLDCSERSVILSGTGWMDRERQVPLYMSVPINKQGSPRGTRKG